MRAPKGNALKAQCKRAWDRRFWGNNQVYIPWRGRWNDEIYESFCKFEASLYASDMVDALLLAHDGIRGQHASVVVIDDPIRQ